MQNSIPDIILLRFPFTSSPIPSQLVSLAGFSFFFFFFFFFRLSWNFCWTQGSILSQISPHLSHTLEVLVSTFLSLQINSKWCFLGTSTLMSHRLLTLETKTELTILTQNCSPARWLVFMTGAILFGFFPLCDCCSKSTQKPSLTPSSP